MGQHKILSLCILETITGTLANSEEPDEMQHNAAFHQGLHCFLRLKRSSYKKVFNFCCKL